MNSNPKAMTTAYVTYMQKWNCDKKKFYNATNATLQKVNEEMGRIRWNIGYAWHNLYNPQYEHAVMVRMIDRCERELELCETIRQIIEEIGNNFYNKCNTELDITSYQVLIRFPRVLHISTSWSNVLKEYFDTIDFEYQITECGSFDDTELWCVTPIIREVKEVKTKRKNETEWHTKRVCDKRVQRYENETNGL